MVEALGFRFFQSICDIFVQDFVSLIFVHSSVTTYYCTITFDFHLQNFDQFCNIMDLPSLAVILRAALSPNPDERKAGEESLNQVLFFPFIFMII